MSEPIRVLQVVTHMNRGGLETMLMNYYRHIDRNILQFDFLTHRKYDGDYGEEIKRLGGIIYHLPVLNPFSPVYKKKLRRFFNSHPEYQVIHVHQDCLSSVILKVAKQQGVKVRIAHSHNASQDKDLKYPIKLLYRHFISRYATELMACGNDAGDWMFCGAQFQILNNAINSADYTFNFEKRQTARKNLNLKNDDFVIGHVGRFSPQKNHAYIIDIFSHLKLQNQNLKLLLVGDDRGELADNIKRKVADLGLSDSVIFTGLRSDVADLMQAMDVFVLPSTYEGIPVSIIEAQASGLPCVISEKVPIECKVTDLVQQVNLSDTVDEWSKTIINVGTDTVRQDTVDSIKEAGFDIVENAKWLQQYYLSKANDGLTEAR